MAPEQDGRSATGERKSAPSPASASADSGRVARRRFLGWATGTLVALAGLVLGVPFIDSLIGPSLRRKKRRFARATSLDGLPTGDPKDVTYTALTSDAFILETEMRSVWVVKHSPTDATVFSPICPHLGCRYDWHPEQGRFVCPCHGSVFALDGKVLDGPAPRPLDTLPHKIEGHELWVEWERFKVGIPEKIEG
jgi:menaquinol-cytochrome c reductase iron-sulfur subunit